VIVIDSSSLVKYLLREKGWQHVEKYLLRGVVTLDHARKEVLNAIWKHYLVKKIIGRELAVELYNAFEKLLEGKVLLIEGEEQYIGRAFEIAMNYHLPLYDSLYVSQALRWGKLLTSDSLQKEVSQNIGIDVIYL
jgi:predicted nucleic acid-binding protein